MTDHVHMSPITRLIRSESFAPDPIEVARVRQVIRDCCKVIGIDPDVPELLASELAANAVRHAETPFKVAFVSLEGRPTRIEVQDASLVLPKPRVAGPDDDGGRGYELIELLAAKWHTDSNEAEGYKIVCITLQGDEEDDSGHGHHVDTAFAGGQHPGSARQPDQRRRALPRGLAAYRSA
ncbi:ATP-binding protein [Kitasatospora purpeofusca]|uniref:ATP-binding protein n=1 Tax=Kitasatospora purpeofusca TaxID=67352 RepID=UPI0035D6138D